MVTVIPWNPVGTLDQNKLRNKRICFISYKCDTFIITQHKFGCLWQTHLVRPLLEKKHEVGRHLHSVAQTAMNTTVWPDPVVTNKKPSSTQVQQGAPPRSRHYQIYIFIGDYISNNDTQMWVFLLKVIASYCLYLENPDRPQKCPSCHAKINSVGYTIPTGPLADLYNHWTLNVVPTKKFGREFTWDIFYMTVI